MLLAEENKVTETSVKIREQLFSLQDIEYRDFCSKITPTVDKETIIGIRVPELRKYSRQLFKAPEASDFLGDLPHKYYEENNLHGFLIEQISDFDKCVSMLETFLPYVDNWATCDLINPKVFKKNMKALLSQIKKWIADNHTYTVRFGIEALMRLYLDEAFSLEYPDMVASVKSEEYYVNMMIAWYFATALAKQYSSIIPYFENQRLDRWTHNKAISKAIESYRITGEQKEYLKTLKIVK